MSPQESFSETYEEHSDAIFRHCFLRVSDRELALDLTQETFTRAWLYLASGKTIVEMRAFLYRIANNLIIDVWRKRKSLSLDALLEEGFDPSDDSHHKMQEGIEARNIRKLFAQLDEACRSVIALRFIDDFSPREIAQILGLSENVVSVRIHRGLEKVRRLMEKRSAQ